MTHEDRIKIFEFCQKWHAESVRIHGEATRQTEAPEGREESIAEFSSRFNSANFKLGEAKGIGTMVSAIMDLILDRKPSAPDDGAESY
jgi:hypothetical protein